MFYLLEHSMRSKLFQKMAEMYWTTPQFTSY